MSWGCHRAVFSLQVPQDKARPLRTVIYKKSKDQCALSFYNQTNSADLALYNFQETNSFACWASRWRLRQIASALIGDEATAGRGRGTVPGGRERSMYLGTQELGGGHGVWCLGAMLWSQREEAQVPLEDAEGLCLS